MQKAIKYFILICFFLLLIFPAYTVQFASEGLLLWYRSILPVLFPFMLISNLLISFNVLDIFPQTLKRFVKWLFHCSDNGIFAILIGFLCGFPMGAKIINQLETSGKIDHTEAVRLNCFTNNVSPAFLLSYVASRQTKQTSMGAALLLSVSGSAVLYGIYLGWKDRSENAELHANPYSAPSFQHLPIPALVKACIMEAVSSIVTLGVYMMLFAVFAGLAALPFARYPRLFLFLHTVPELTAGIQYLVSGKLSRKMRYILLSALCSFGGISSMLQAFGLGEMSKEMRKEYKKSRIVITLLSVIIASLISLVFCI